MYKKHRGMLKAIWEETLWVTITVLKGGLKVEKYYFVTCIFHNHFLAGTPSPKLWTI